MTEPSTPSPPDIEPRIPEPVSTPAETATAPVAPAKKTNSVPVLAALAVGALLGGASGAGVATVAITSSQGSSTGTTSGPQTITVNNEGSVSSATAIAAKASPSVVTIDVSTPSSGGSGSGIVLSSDGYVLTNAHVVTLSGATAGATIEVTTYDGRLYTAKIVGVDPIVDLAVIKLADASGLQPIEFADSAKLNVGDQAVAIGAPLGLSNSVSDGIVSALNRSIQIASSAAPEDTSGDDSSDEEGNGQGGPFEFWNFGQEPGGSTSQSATISIPVVQTDAAINPGNSGGALVNSRGEVIGVVVAIASTGGTISGSQSGSIGVGFSIPSNLAKRVADEIIATGTATHGLLGATVRDATSDTSETVGAQINDVTGGGAAETAGLKPGDVITQFNGLPITSSVDLTAQVRALAAGTTTNLTYVRGGDSRTIDVTLGSLK